MLRICCLLGVFLVCFASLVGQCNAQYGTQDASPRSRFRSFPIRAQELGERTPESVTWVANQSVKDPRLLEQSLPLLVDSLLDENSRVRASAARGLGATAIKLERLAFQRMKTPPWESIGSHYEQALLRLQSQPKLARHRKQVEQLIARFGRRGESSVPASIPSEPDFLTQFFSKWDENDSTKIAESWTVLQQLMADFSREEQIAIWRELVESSSPKLIQFALAVSDRWDDAIVQSLIADVESDSREEDYRVLELATPAERATVERLVALALNEKCPLRLRLAALRSISQCSQCDGSVVEKLADGIVRCPNEIWNSTAWPVVYRHQEKVPTNSLAALRGHLAARGVDEACSFDEQGAAIKRLAELDDRDPNTRDIVLRSLRLQSVVPEQISGDLLAAIQSIIDSDRPIEPEFLDLLFRIVSTGSEDQKVLALRAMRNASELSNSQLQYLISILADCNQDAAIKSHAARIVAGQKSPPLALINDKLAEHMAKNVGDRCVVDLLRTIESMGVKQTLGDDLCSQIARDNTYTVQERIAAWYTRARTAAATDSFSQQVLTTLRKGSEPAELKAASLIALASVLGECTLPILREYATDEDYLVKCTARYAQHLAGDSDSAARQLIELVPTAESPELLESLLQEIGGQARELLWQVVEAPLVSEEQRMMAYRVLVNAKPVEWDRMLQAIAQEPRGENFANALLQAWQYDASIVPALYSRIEGLASDSLASVRYWQLLENVTGDLGGGSDADAWGDSPIRLAMLSTAVPSKKAMPEPEIAEAQSALPSSGAIAAQSAPPAPVASVAASSASAVQQSVDVFYATNRQLRDVANFGAGLKWFAFSIAILCTFVCLIAFARQRSFAYAFVSLVGLLGLTALARESLDMNYWFPNRVAIYNGEYSDQIKLGVCQVTIPKGHVPGELESPSFLLRWEVKPDPEKHIVLKSTEPLEHAEFYSKLQQDMNKSGRNLLVFIHGYNVSFEDAARRTAQMSVDLKFPGAPVFYSWPSYSNWYRYPDDAANIQMSVAQIRSFLQELARESNADSINLVAHSMGNVGLTQALAGIEAETPMFNQVVLAAPDIDAEVFRNEIAPRIRNKANRITLYTSQTDLALLASRYFNSGDRVGDSSRGVVVVDGIETIDATSIDSSLLGHSYYGSNVNVLDDIANLLHNKPITARGYLEFQSESTPPFWSFSSEIRAANAANATKR